MTPPTFQELLTSQEARFTNEQLEAWAGLGPWRALGTDPAEGVDCFWIKGQPNPAMRGFSDEIASVNGSQNDPKRQTNAALIAAAPALAAALLSERKAREVEVGELKRLQAERDSAILWIHRLANNPRKPSTWMETREAASNFLANLLQTGKDQPHE